MIDPLNDPSMPDEIRTAVRLQAESEGVGYAEWLSRAALRELAHSPRGPRTTAPLKFYGGGVGHVIGSPHTPEKMGGLLLYPSYPSNLLLMPSTTSGELKSLGMYKLSLFYSRMDQGALLLAAAFMEGAIANFQPHLDRTHRRRARTWFDRIVLDCRDRSQEVRQALLLSWQPSGRAAELAIEAFRTLSELTQTSWELQRLCESDRPRAFGELARHLELATQQFELNARLVAEVEGIDTQQEETWGRLGDIQNDLLQRAGGGLSLTEASNRLNLSRQGIHKRAKNGTALGIMLGNELVFPLAQWVVEGNGLKPIEGLALIVRLFSKAGGWSALQFLIEQDPNLGTTPRLALIEGRVKDVIAAAEAYLGVEEDA